MDPDSNNQKRIKKKVGDCEHIYIYMYACVVARRNVEIRVHLGSLKVGV